ncbi:MAG: nickel-responsive transcriptional regulator NikR [Candidatus Atribacteria bacterium]|nr:nickel-responsive transcriptional regulator NikR [Candidatus Atribacteria bacterium]
MMRISMSLPRSLLREFDAVIDDRGYRSRSKGIRDALKDYIVRYQWMNEMKGEYIGILAVIYDHHYTGVMEDLTDVQHRFRQYINAVMHLHMSEDHCLEVIVVKGDVEYIRSLTEKIMRLKGVEHVKLTSTASGSPDDA